MASTSPYHAIFPKKNYDTRAIPYLIIFQKNYDNRTVPYTIYQKNYDTRRHSKANDPLFNGGHLQNESFKLPHSNFCKIFLFLLFSKNFSFGNFFKILHMKRFFCFQNEIFFLFQYNKIFSVIVLYILSVTS